MYKARLRVNGNLVAIKVQRPNCESTISLDLYVLRFYAGFLTKALKALNREVDLTSIIDDFGELIYREIDYRAEMVNCQRFAELYANIPDVFVPKVGEGEEEGEERATRGVVLSTISTSTVLQYILLCSGHIFMFSTAVHLSRLSYFPVLSRSRETRCGNRGQRIFFYRPCAMAVSCLRPLVICQQPLAVPGMQHHV